MLRLFVLLTVVAPGIAMAEFSEAGNTRPAYVLQLPDSVSSILIAETDTSTLHQYKPVPSGLEHGDVRYMSVGQDGVGKKRAGDRRTPLGIYFVSEQLDTSGLHEKYGPIAFPLDYPNAWDSVNDRTGDGIWIHGVANNGGRRPPLDTDGCIVLPNAELLDLQHYIDPLITPVIITRQVRLATIAQIVAIRNELSAALDNWVLSYRDGDWYGYLALYAEDFEYRGLDHDEWLAYRLRSVAARPITNFTIDDVLLLADPEEENLFLSRFRQTITERERMTVTTKRLYWRRNGQGKLLIVAEDNG